MKLYRYQMQIISETFFSYPELVEISLEVIGETEKSYTCEDEFFHKKRIVLKKGRNIYARPTKEAALHDLFCRKIKQAEILRHQLNMVEITLKKLTNEHTSKISQQNV
jgi:hypothetical protein